MKHLLQCLLLVLAIGAVGPRCLAQPGTWTWMKGVPQGNTTGVYGVLGVPSSNNRPPSLYEAADWTDLSGNFWMFGGVDYFSNIFGALWRFTPATNTWTWMNGPQSTSTAGVYGVQGVAAPGNRPGARGWGPSSCVDLNGNLWLFGGYGIDAAGNLGNLSDLWKYDITTGEWTWMSGPRFINVQGVYGTLGVPSANNFPNTRSESNAIWVDSNNNIWIFGGQSQNGYLYDDVWRYNIGTDEWTWMAGSNISSAVPVYGTLGVAAPSNTPGARAVYSTWTDCDDNLWLFGGSTLTNIDFADMWKFDPVSAQWTWMGGSNATNTATTYTTRCAPSTATIPSGRFENRACWTDQQGRFWSFGGAQSWNYAGLSDLWCFDPNSGEFTWVAGPNVGNQLGVYGSLGVGAPGNVPGGRAGSAHFQDLQGNFWVFGGYDFVNGLIFADLWKYTLDSLCPATTFSNGNVVASFSVQSVSGCAPFTVNFNNISSNAQSYYWNFGDNNFSSNPNPTHSYSSIGSHTVTLIARATTCAPQADTMTMNIVVTAGFPLDIGPDQNLCQGDSLVLNASINGGSYLWSDNSTNASLTVLQAGLYWVEVTNSAGCIMRDSIVVHQLSSTFTLGPDQLICNADATVLDAGNPGAAYLWSTNANTQTISVDSSGDYSVQVTEPSGCVLRDTVSIVVAPPLVVDLGQDRLICPGTSTYLDAGNHPNGAFLWSTNEQTQSIIVAAAGVVWLQITDNIGCVGRDTVIVAFSPVPSVVLGNDTAICEENSLNLDAGNVGSSYQWSTGATTQTIAVGQAGYYAVNVTSPPGCTGSGSISIGMLHDFALELGKDSVFCADKSWTLRGGSPELNHLWSTGSQTPTFTTTESGLYWVDAWNTCFMHRDSIRLTFLVDSSGPYIPTAFTPNGDGLNDVFKVEGLHTDATFQMRIYDRWGKLIFETSNPMEGWDGNAQGRASQEGVYPIWVRVSDCRGEIRPIRGAVTLIR
jgi:gliding motility-associated-like protein